MGKISPMLIFVFCGLLLYKQNEVSAAFGLSFGFLPYTFLSIAMLLSWYFNRSVIFFTSLITTFGLYLSKYFQSSDPISSLIYASTSFLLPINVLILASLKEKGIFTKRGKTVLGVLFLQLYFAGLAITSMPDLLKNFFGTELISSSIFALTPLSQVSIITFLITILVMAIKEVFAASMVNESLLGILLATFFALHFRFNLTASNIMYIGAGLIVTISILQHSYRIAFYDELTRLPSRRALKEELLKQEGSYVIAMVDVDHFKGINDTYGHDVGDNVLKMVSSVLLNMKIGGKAFRYGGEEFLILFPKKRVQDVLEDLEELRECIASRSFTLRGKKRPQKKPKSATTKTKKGKQISVTVSIGAAEKNTALKTAEAVIKAADKALYEAKNKGRNRVCS